MGYSVDENWAEGQRYRIRQAYDNADSILHAYGTGYFDDFNDSDKEADYRESVKIWEGLVLDYLNRLGVTFPYGSDLSGLYNGFYMWDGWHNMTTSQALDWLESEGWFGDYACN